MDIEKEHIGKCSCCGGIITLQIINGSLIRWICEEQGKYDMCDNYGRECKKENCLLEKKEIRRKRKKYRKKIQETFFSILKKKGYVGFEESNEILISLLELNLEKRGGYIIQKVEDKIWKIWKKGGEKIV